MRGDVRRAVCAASEPAVAAHRAHSTAHTGEEGESTPSTASIKLTGKHWERGDDNRSGTLKVDIDVQSWQQDLVIIDLQSSV